MTVSCIECLHWDRKNPVPSPDPGDISTWARCQLFTGRNRNGTNGQKGRLAAGTPVFTGADFGCKDALWTRDGREEEFTEAYFWRVRVPDIRRKLAGEEPGTLARLDELAYLLANLRDYAEAVQSSIEGLDPDEPYAEAQFGNTGMERTITLMRSLSLTEDSAITPEAFGGLTDRQPKLNTG